MFEYLASLAAELRVVYHDLDQVDDRVMIIHDALHMLSGYEPTSFDEELKLILWVEGVVGYDSTKELSKDSDKRAGQLYAASHKELQLFLIEEGF